MHIQIRVEDASDAWWLPSLYRWLRDDQDVSAAAELTLSRPGDPSSQGAVFDVINAVISQGIGAGGLAVAYATWRGAHRSAPAVTFSCDKVTVTVTDASPETIRNIVEALRECEPAAVEAPQSRPPAPQQPDTET
jgi:hypothetical protein